jgi:hypothetical protein
VFVAVGIGVFVRSCGVGEPAPGVPVAAPGVAVATAVRVPGAGVPVAGCAVRVAVLPDGGVCVRAAAVCDDDGPAVPAACVPVGCGQAASALRGAREAAARAMLMPAAITANPSMTAMEEKRRACIGDTPGRGQRESVAVRVFAERDCETVERWVRTRRRARAGSATRPS